MKYLEKYYLLQAKVKIYKFPYSFEDLLYVIRLFNDVHEGEMQIELKNIEEEDGKKPKMGGEK